MLSFSAEPFVFQFAIQKIEDFKVHSTIILPVVSCWCQTCSLTYREECRLRVFENRFLRRIFWTRRDEVIGEWRKLHNEEINDLNCSTNNFRMIKSRRM